MTNIKVILKAVNLTSRPYLLKVHGLLSFPQTGQFGDDSFVFPIVVVLLAS